MGHPDEIATAETQSLTLQDVGRINFYYYYNKSVKYMCSNSRINFVLRLDHTPQGERENRNLDFSALLSHNAAIF